MLLWSNYPKEIWYKGTVEWINKKPRQRFVLRRPVNGGGGVTFWRE